jgi:hypothetical protein
MQSQSELDLDRRTKSRFPLRLSVKYRTISDGPSFAGEGQTVNISSCGLLVASDEARFRTGVRLRLTVDWPFLLHGIIPLQLVVSCRVTRCQPQEFAVRLDRYQFKTRGLKAGFGARAGVLLDRLNFSNFA